MENETLAVSLKKACDMTGVSRSTFYRLVGAGRVRLLKVGRRSLVDMASLRAFLAAAPLAEIRAT